MRGAGGRGVCYRISFDLCAALLFELYAPRVEATDDAGRAYAHRELVRSTQLSELGPAAEPRAVGPLKCVASLLCSALTRLTITVFARVRV